MNDPSPQRRGRRGSPESWSVDAHVGQRVRMRRTLLGMSQEKLGDAIGLTFQQVQKYERGSNRISAGTLFRLGQVLDVPISFFFDNYNDPHGGPQPARRVEHSAHTDGVISRREARLLRLWRAAPAAVADELLALLASLSPHLSDAPGDVEEKAPLVIKPRKLRGKSASSGKGGKPRRRHGAIWDPADIYRAAKAPTPTRG